jgi:hypothetical protein
MRSLLLSVMTLLAIGLPNAAFSQDCRELRRACEMRDQLGERGQGNCRRYREACEQPSQRDTCAELRLACLHKDQLGEQGQGNCRRYRQMCRGQL